MKIKQVVLVFTESTQPLDIYEVKEAFKDLSVDVSHVHIVTIGTTE
jgi:hypothetical protein